MNIFNCKIVLNIRHGCGSIVLDSIHDSNVPDMINTELKSFHHWLQTLTKPILL